MNRNRVVQVFSLLVLAAFGSMSLFGGTLTLDNNPSTVYQQTTNNPCIIAGPCANNPFAFTLIGPNLASWDLLSPAYTIAEINSLFASGFVVAIDMNQANNETGTLNLFEMVVGNSLDGNNNITGGTTYDSYTGPGDLIVNFNGNGYSDNVLNGFTALAGDSHTYVQFHASLTNLSDGRETLFLAAGEGVPPPPEVPEPGSMLLMGGGLLGLALIARKRK